MNPSSDTSRHRPTLSVALCTYNGATYLRAQLESIAKQTRLPDELLVRDDRSKDDTLRIVEAWSAGIPFRVRVEVNAENLGSTHNFARAIAEARGEIIILCDQDDVWLPQKLERIVAFFDEHPATEAVFTDGWVVDQTLNQQELLSKNRGFRSSVVQRNIARGRMLAALSERAMATGATMALRAGLRDTIFPLPERLPRDLIHDGWIALVAALRGTLGFLDEPLILYRQHAGQQVGVSPGRDPAQPLWQSGSARAQILADSAADSAILAEILHARFPELAAKLRPFDQRREHQFARRDLPASRLRRLWPVLREWLGGRYHRFASGTRTGLADLLN